MEQITINVASVVASIALVQKQDNTRPTPFCATPTAICATPTAICATGCGLYFTEIYVNSVRNP